MQRRGKARKYRILKVAYVRCTMRHEKERPFRPALPTREPPRTRLPFRHFRLVFPIISRNRLFRLISLVFDLATPTTARSLVREPYAQPQNG
jgi:hypothetical protein